jgi:hypothetical protein
LSGHRQEDEADFVATRWKARRAIQRSASTRAGAPPLVSIVRAPGPTISSDVAQTYSMPSETPPPPPYTRSNPPPPSPAVAGGASQPILSPYAPSSPSVRITADSSLGARRVPSSRTASDTPSVAASKHRARAMLETLRKDAGGSQRLPLDSVATQLQRSRRLLAEAEALDAHGSSVGISERTAAAAPTLPTAASAPVEDRPTQKMGAITAYHDGAGADIEVADVPRRTMSLASLPSSAPPPASPLPQSMRLEAVAEERSEEAALGRLPPSWGRRSPVDIGSLRASWKADMLQTTLSRGNVARDYSHGSSSFTVAASSATPVAGTPSELAQGARAQPAVAMRRTFAPTSSRGEGSLRRIGASMQRLAEQEGGEEMASHSVADRRGMQSPPRRGFA